MDRAGIALCANYSSDSYWTQATIKFSDGSREVVSLEKDKDLQFFDFEKRKVEWVEIKELIKAEDESPFPALTQLEVCGRYSLFSKRPVIDQKYSTFLYEVVSIVKFTNGL